MEYYYDKKNLTTGLFLRSLDTSAFNAAMCIHDFIFHNK